MMDGSPKSRQTVTSIFFLVLRLMCKEPPLWAFPCTDCQDKDGRFRVLTADGIWMGFLTRLASGQYQHPSHPCASVKALVDAASSHPSEWVRRFLRMALKQLSKKIVIKAGQLRSAMRALALLCPAALPDHAESLSDARKQCLQHLLMMLASVWSLPHSCMSLCDAIVVFIRKLLGPRSRLSAEAIAEHQPTLEQLLEWKAGLLRPHLHRDAVVVGGNDAGAAAPAPVDVGDEGGALAAAGGGGIRGGQESGALAPAHAMVADGRGGGAPVAVGGGGTGGGRHAGAAAPAPTAVGGGAGAGAFVGGAAAGGGHGHGHGNHAAAAARAPAVVEGGAGAGAGLGVAAAGGGHAARGGNDAAAAAPQLVAVTQPAPAADGRGACLLGDGSGAGDGLAAGGARVEGGEPAARRAPSAGQRENRAAAGALLFAVPARARRARAPAATARERLLDHTTSEPGEARCLRPATFDLGVTLHKDVVSFCLALAVDPVVNTYKKRHCQALSSLSVLLKAVNAMEQLNDLFKYFSDSIDAHPELPDAQVQMALLLLEHRVLFSFLAAISSSSTLFESMRCKVADVLSSLRVVVEDYHSAALDSDGSAAAYAER